MIIVRLQGGMGNQLFQYALGRKLALKYEVPLKLDTTFLYNQTRIPILRPNFVPRSYALDLFQITAQIAQKKDIIWRYARPFLHGWAMQCIDAGLRKLALFPGWEKRFAFDGRIFSPGPNAYLVGFWQSPRYFSDIREILLKEFTLKTALPSHIEAIRSKIASEKSVCIHVRRSDFVGGFHGTSDVEYYRKALEIIRKRNDAQSIYVFSDDIAWCKVNIQLGQAVEFIGDEYSGDRGIGHFELMRSCTHFVIPNSTFSWWAAWLAESADKVVVAPKKWFATGHNDTKDLFPPDWILL